MERITEQIERWKATAEIFLKDNVQTYIKDASNNIYFCDLILIGDDTLTVQCFGPEQRAGQKIILYWSLIVKFDKYNDEVRE